MIWMKIRIWIQIREIVYFLSDSSPLRDGAKNEILYSMIFQRVVEELLENLVDDLVR